MFLDKIKTVIFLLALTFILLIIGFAIGGTVGLTIALILSVLMNISSYWYSDKIVLKIYNARKAEYFEFTKLHEIVKEVALRANLKTPRIYVIESENPNAFATGRSENKAIIAVTTSLLTLLSDQELKGVIAHEIGHIKNKDLLISTVSVTIASAIAYLAIAARLSALFKSKEEDNRGFLELLVLSIVAPISATILRLAMSRSREYTADETGAKLIKDPDSLSNALIKLETSPKLKQGNRAASNLFIVNPFSGDGLLGLLSTHPSTTSRIKRLRKQSYSMN